ncbi:hypothetical protein quinque_002414 [Culex quinquefasciatus]|uniref:Uncharacterized protein n=1 Tax=Culex pipiens pipiens TaxID=38569 RepID=A0ABD1DXJ7_CULPP
MRESNQDYDILQLVAKELIQNDAGFSHFVRNPNNKLASRQNDCLKALINALSPATRLNRGRSVEMMDNTVPMLFGFTMLDSSKMPVVPSFVQIESHGGEGIVPNLDDTFQIVLKKMLKKDPTTRTKAL